jgi:peptidyl-prolyl cis-trans isomerase C
MWPILRLHGPMRRSAALEIRRYSSRGLPSLGPFARNLGQIFPSSTRAIRRAVFAFIVAASVLGARADTRADDTGEKARRAQVVAHIGPTRVITVGELEDRLAALPAFQRATFGKDPAAVRRAFLDQVLVPDALEALGAEAQGLAKQLPTSTSLERARSQATVRAIRGRLGPESAIPMTDVQKYYDENRARYDTPERLQIWRVLCETKDEAQSVLAEAKKEPTPKEFGELARQHSLDKASSLRAGNLGFLAPDGTSNEPGLRVDAAIVRAAAGVRDGELVPAPVPEGDHWSVVWRRGTIAASRRSVDDVAAQIRDTLWKARVKEQTDALVASLRAAKLHDFDPAPLALLGATPTPDAGPRPRASSAARDAR